MKNFITAAFCIFSFSLFAQKSVEEVKSEKLNGTRQIMISLPSNYEKEPDRKFPLVILLDGEYLFDAFSGTLSYANYWDDLPPVIMVGISQNKKGERFTDSQFDKESGLPEEGGSRFYEFIGSELIPALEKKYRIAPFRVIAGHDTTAGFLNFYLYKDQPLFNAYISLSPELAPEMETRIAERLAILKQPIFYYQATADGDLKKMQKRIKELDENIKKVGNPNLNYRFDEFKNATHYSLVPYAIPNALYQIFSAYQPISTIEFQEKIATLPSGYVDYLANKYEIIEKSLGIKMPIRVNDFKAIEAAILKNKAYAEFEKLSGLAKKSYPKAMLADYELGMMYEHTGEYKKAFKSYQNAYTKNEIGDLTKDMMLEKADEMKSK
ncbi:alpha/beta hydrolase [Flavobacterium microcysteis]|uniref:Alpha/beta hydrolase n=1 Tax=Flavobacterium microcysteis TaxID=2596891 RepID=A0A501Q972_9FLAO|nr:alpha/beta hydrolase-fold protein [Flavobacterium microcysteis]TPD68576.1 alpha/beta hydrolase [Flavobacterium microcysteis]